MSGSGRSLSGLRIIFAGSGEFGLPTLRSLLEEQEQIVMVVSQPDRPAGRGRKLTPTPVGRFALERGLPLLRTEDINTETLPPADLMLVIAFGQKIAPQIVRHPRLGSINLHASLLPKYRGAAPINWAILDGQTVTGNSVIRLAQKMDAGDILGQAQMPIGPVETAGELHDRLAVAGARLVREVLQQLASGRATETPQDESQASSAPKLTREASRIDWGRGAKQIACQIRGLYPWPGCRVRVVDRQGQDRGRLTLVRARVGGEATRPPGFIEPGGRICAGDGRTVEILEVQPEGRCAMSIAAYRNGHPWEDGMRLESL